MGNVAHRAKLRPTAESGDEFRNAELRRRDRKIEEEQRMLTVNHSPAIETPLPWWAVYARHQHEKTAAEMMTTKGLEVFLPLYTSVRRWKDRRKLLSLPLFPGYMFVRGAPGLRLQVLTTPGVHMILSQGDQAAAIPEEEIEAIRRTLEGNFRVEPHPFLKCGQRVRVKCGSLSGIEGILVRKKSVFRLVLSVQMLAQSVAVEIDAADVEPVGVGAATPPTEREMSVTQLQRYSIPPYGVRAEHDAMAPKGVAIAG
jgi:transcription antitermination factor NusG